MLAWLEVALAFYHITSHHDSASALANAGFVVATVNHSGDNFHDLGAQGKLVTLASRVTDIYRLVDYMTKDWSQHGKLIANKVGFFGFSRGGFTGLVATGAVADFNIGLEDCKTIKCPLCEDLKTKKFPKQSVVYV